jgi:hypothetical protein
MARLRLRRFTGVLKLYDGAACCLIKLFDLQQASASLQTLETNIKAT